MQIPGSNPSSHYALTKALASGTPRIDEALREIGGTGTSDVTPFEGHLYANKAPGLAALAVPAYAVLKAAGARVEGDPTQMTWALHLWALLVPAALMLWLVYRLGERLAPGTGAPAAVTLGLGTLVLPFSTVLYSHVLAAALLLSAFAALTFERDGRARLGLVALAGLLAGLAFLVEYPAAIGGAVLGLYAALRPGLLRRASAYGAGAAVGIALLLLYNWWAFGTPTRWTYAGTTAPGPDQGWLTTPSLDRLSTVLFSARGLLPLAPVVACGAAGLVVLYRRGRRAEALAAGGIVVAYLLFNACYPASTEVLPGPRHLIVALPFLAVGLSAAFRAFPAATAVLAAVSVFQMVVVTATFPMAAYDGRWLERLLDGELGLTAASLVGVTGWYAMLPLFAAAPAAVGCAAAAARGLRPGPRDAALAATALAAWVALALAAPNAAGRRLDPAYTLALALALAAAAAAPVLVRALRGKRSDGSTVLYGNKRGLPDESR